MARNIIPSVQPTHATSDMYWAESRLGSSRLNGAYSYASLLKQNNWLPLGTDFPVEAVSPFYTFDAAVSRKDAKGFPLNGFLPNESLSREEALMGITIWAAKAGFMDDVIGSLEVNKRADFIVLDVDLLKDDLLKIRNQKAKYLYLSGQRVK
jgi:predicted amidohydrolase YtcJ